MPFDDLEKRDLYSILGVEKNDPSGAVHQAFIELVPKHTPEKDPEGFRALQIAYQTLMDPKAREEYDNLMGCGKEIADLMNASFAAMIQGRDKRAEHLIRKIVDETGGASEALMLLGMVQFEQGHINDAIHTLRELVERFPRVALYRINLGNMLINRYRDVEGEEAKEHILKRAREQYLEAIELDDRNQLAFLEMAKTYIIEKNVETAFEWCERAVGMKGKASFEDFDALLYGFIVLSHQDDFSRLREQIERIENCLPDEEDIRQFATSVLVQASLSLVHDRKIKAARELIELARKLSPKYKELNMMIRDLEVGMEADLMWDDFINDPEIIQPIRDMADRMFEHFMMRASADRLELAAKDFFEKLNDWDTMQIKRSLERMKRFYPAIWNLNLEFWQNLLSLAQGDKPLGGVSKFIIHFFVIVVIFLLLRTCLSDWL